MDPLRLNHRLEHRDVCAELLNMAQRELTALFRTVSESFGAEQAELSAEDWLHEVEASSVLPASAREWRQLTVKVIAQLAERCGQIIAAPVSGQLQPASY
jgi:plasmid stabilization system protein ParE